MSRAEHRERTALIESPEHLVNEVVPQFMPEAEKGKIVRVEAFQRGTPGLREALESPVHFPSGRNYEVHEQQYTLGGMIKIYDKEFNSTRADLEKRAASQDAASQMIDSFMWLAAYPVMGALALFGVPIIGCQALFLSTIGYSIGKAWDSLGYTKGNPRAKRTGTVLLLEASAVLAWFATSFFFLSPFAILPTLAGIAASSLIGLIVGKSTSPSPLSRFVWDIRRSKEAF